MPRSETNRRILVVEDEYFIADEIVRLIEREGMCVAGPVSTWAAAKAEIERQAVDQALVDINLDGSISFETAMELRRRGIPFLFLTGYDATVVPPDLAGTIVLQKPFDERALLEAVRQLEADAAEHPAR